MGIIMQRDNGHETLIKGNDDGGWSPDDMVLWLGMRQNKDAIEW
jgi:hypothetical protein